MKKEYWEVFNMYKSLFDDLLEDTEENIDIFMGFLDSDKYENEDFKEGYLYCLNKFKNRLEELEKEYFDANIPECMKGISEKELDDAILGTHGNPYVVTKKE